MVGPSVSDDERLRTTRMLKAGFVLLIAASGALVAYQGGGDATLVAASFAGCLVVGAALTWFVVRNLRQIQPEGMRTRRNRAPERQNRDGERDERKRRNRRR